MKRVLPVRIAFYPGTGRVNAFQSGPIQLSVADVTWYLRVEWALLI